ncbi:MAG TPA: aa3-type cytochrome c oxidase subunit IV [Devosia sp.]|jgi:hypothetical protein|nr:aa3-type cytochrome c oxidase subunit IV [Devosia sp.]
MTHEVAHAELVIDANEAEQMDEAMDYAQHRATWDGFTNLVKWMIIELALIVLALFCLIQGNAPAGGVLFLLIAVVAPIAGLFFRSAR